MGPVHPDPGSATNTGPMRRFVRPVALALALAAGASACGGSKYEYLNEAGEGVYFKVPRAWDYQDVLAAEREGRVEGDASGIDEVWKVTFGSQVAKPDLSALTATSPGGTVTVYSGDLFQVDGMSTGSLRAALFGIDPLNPGDEPNPDLELVSAAEVATPDGAHGFRVAVNLNIPVPDDPEAKVWVTRDVLYLLDDVRRRVYVIEVGCDSACYVANRPEIDAVMNSFTVDPA